MKFDFHNSTLRVLLALLAGFGLGLAYSWRISPVTYVDANPAILRADFKDLYRVVIAASYASTQDLPRARARLELLGDADVVGGLSAQAQRMLAAGEPFDRVRSIAQLATDLGRGVVSAPFTSTPSAPLIDTPIADTPFIEETIPTNTVDPEIPTLFIEATPLAPPSLITPTPRPTFTPIPAPGAPFTLVGQDTVCDRTLREGLLQVMLMDARRRQVPGIQITITWPNGENHFFTGLKPELGNGYADFIMQADTVYSIRVIEGGSIVANITTPTCTEPNGSAYRGGLLLTFQQP